MDAARRHRHAPLYRRLRDQPFSAQLTVHLFVLAAIVLLGVVALGAKYESFLHHRTHALIDLDRRTNLWRRNCLDHRARTDAEGELDCDELRCFTSKSATRIALANTLEEVNVVGRLFSPATWQYITSNLGAAAFVLALLYIAGTFALRWTVTRACGAVHHRRAEQSTLGTYCNDPTYYDPVTGEYGDAKKLQ